MRIAVASGKGGTGKTTVVTNLAYALAQEENIQVLDCDVEEPNVHLFLQPHVIQTRPVKIRVPEVDNTACQACGLCVDRCEFNALSLVRNTVMVFSDLCHSCGGCMLYCPHGAIREKAVSIGEVRQGVAGKINLIDGLLTIGSPLAPAVIDNVLSLADTEKDVIIDAPPGTSCSVVASVKDADYCILVTEPTPFGENDLYLAIRMAKKLDVPIGVVVNRAGSGNRGVYGLCEKERVPVLLEIPFDMRIARQYARGELLSQHSLEWQKCFRQLWQQIRGLVSNE